MWWRYAGERREAKLKVHLEEHVSLVKFDPAGSIELHLLAGAPKELGNELREKLNAWTGRRWMVALSKTPGERPIGEVAREREAAELREIEKHPAVAAVLQQFPDAQRHQRAAAAGHQEGRNRHGVKAEAFGFPFNTNGKPSTLILNPRPTRSARSAKEHR